MDASFIPVHREVYAGTAAYFNPYSIDDLEQAIERVIAPANSARRGELVEMGAEVSARYTYDAILPQWEAFLQSLRG